MLLARLFGRPPLELRGQHGIPRHGCIAYNLEVFELAILEPAYPRGEAACLYRACLVADVEHHVTLLDQQVAQAILGCQVHLMTDPFGRAAGGPQHRAVDGFERELAETGWPQFSIRPVHFQPWPPLIRRSRVRDPHRDHQIEHLLARGLVAAHRLDPRKTRRRVCPYLSQKRSRLLGAVGLHRIDRKLMNNLALLG